MFYHHVSICAPEGGRRTIQQPTFREFRGAPNLIHNIAYATARYVFPIVISLPVAGAWHGVGFGQGVLGTEFKEKMALCIFFLGPERANAC